MKIEVLYPEVCNLYGDLQNVQYLKRCCDEIEIVETDLKTRPRFLDEDIALVYMGSTTEQGLRLAADALRPLKAQIQAKLDAGQRILLTGNAQDIFLSRIESDKAPVIEGVGLLPGCARYQMMKRHNSFFLGRFEDIDIVGFKSLFGHTWDAGEDNGWFTAERGIGRNPETAAEGFRIGNLLATYLIGPLLILNPPLCKWFLREMGLPDALAFEAAAMDSYQKRVAEFREPTRSWKY